MSVVITVNGARVEAPAGTTVAAASTDVDVDRASCVAVLAAIWVAVETATWVAVAAAA